MELEQIFQLVTNAGMAPLTWKKMCALELNCHLGGTGTWDCQCVSPSLFLYMSVSEAALRDEMNDRSMQLIERSLHSPS